MIKMTCRTTAISALCAALMVGACGGEKPEAMIASAKEYMAKKDNKAAVIQLKNAIQVVPQHAEARFLLGKALVQSGELVVAEVELRKAMELGYPADLVVPQLASVMLATGQAKKIIAEFGKVELSSADSKADLQTTLSAAYAGVKDQAGAESALALAIQAKPDHLPAMMLQAREKAGKGDMDGALAIVDAIIAKAPEAVGALKMKGDLLQAQKGGAEGFEWYRKALAVRPDYVSAHTALVQSLMRQGKTEETGAQLEQMKKVAPTHPQTIFLEAQYAVQKRDFKTARDRLQVFHKRMAPTALSLQLAGAIEYGLGSYVGAEENFGKALQLAPGLPFSQRMLISTYLRQGKTEKAMSSLQPLLGKIDTDPTLLTLAGEVFAQSGDMKKAEGYYAKAAKLDPSDPLKRTRLAVTHLVRGDANAMDELEDIAASDSDTTADFALINAYLRGGKLDKAVQATAMLIKKQPKDAGAHDLMGQILLAKKDEAGARNSFQQALSLNPAYFASAWNLAGLDLAANKPEEAKRRYESVLTADPKNTKAMLAIADILVRTNGKLEEVVAVINRAISIDSSDPMPRALLIEAYLRGNDAKKALTAAQDAVAALPNNVDVLSMVGRAQLAAGDHNQALVSFNKIASLKPDSPVPYVRIAEVQNAANNKDAAVRNLQKALEMKADYLEAQRDLFALRLEAGKNAEALAIAKEVQKQRPKEAVGYAMEGDMNALRQQWGEATKAYRLGMDKAPSPELVRKLYSASMAAGEKGQAEKLASSWIKEHPKDTRFMMFLADDANLRKDYPNAARQYAVLLQSSPDNAVLLNNMAWVSGELKDPKAIEYAEKANKLSPDQPAFMDTLALLLSEKGDATRATDLLRKAVALAPQSPQIRFSLARVLVKGGQKAEARKELEELSKLGDKFPAQAEVAKLLKEI